MSSGCVVSGSTTATGSTSRAVATTGGCFDTMVAGSLSGTASSSFKRVMSYKRKRINSSYSRVKRLHQAKEKLDDDGLEASLSSETNSSSENDDNHDDDDDDDDDLSTDSVRSDYPESNEDKEASCDEKKSSNRYILLDNFKKIYLGKILIICFIVVIFL